MAQITAYSRCGQLCMFKPMKIQWILCRPNDDVGFTITNDCLLGVFLYKTLKVSQLNIFSQNDDLKISNYLWTSSSTRLLCNQRRYFFVIYGGLQNTVFIKVFRNYNPFWPCLDHSIAIAQYWWTALYVLRVAKTYAPSLPTVCSISKLSYILKQKCFINVSFWSLKHI